MIQKFGSVRLDRLDEYEFADYLNNLPFPTLRDLYQLVVQNDHDFGRHVVHGHTPQRSGRPEIRRFRTNLDTAAVYGGALTAGVFSDAQGPALEFLQVRAA